MSALTPCSACARHVRTDSSACPFCGAARDARPESAPWFPRASRAVLFTAGASLALAAGADAFVGTAHADTNEAVSMVPQYGAPSDYQPPPDPPASPVTPPDAGAPSVDAGGQRPPTAPRRPRGGS